MPIQIRKPWRNCNENGRPYFRYSCWEILNNIGSYQRRVIVAPLFTALKQCNFLCCFVWGQQTSRFVEEFVLDTALILERRWESLARCPFPKDSWRPFCVTIVGWPLSRLANKKDHHHPTFGDWDLGLPMAEIFMGHHATEFVESQLPYFFHNHFSHRQQTIRKLVKLSEYHIIEYGIWQYAN